MQEYGNLERREIEEAFAFRLLWKGAILAIVTVLGMSILDNLPKNASFTVRSVTYVVLSYTLLSLLLMFRSTSDDALKRAAGLFCLGLVMTSCGLWFRIITIG